jgi:hypothetical protein
MAWPRKKAEIGNSNTCSGMGFSAKDMNKTGSASVLAAHGSGFL